MIVTVATTCLRGGLRGQMGKAELVSLHPGEDGARSLRLAFAATGWVRDSGRFELIFPLIRVRDH